MTHFLRTVRTGAIPAVCSLALLLTAVQCNKNKATSARAGAAGVMAKTPAELAAELDPVIREVAVPGRIAASVRIEFGRALYGEPEEKTEKQKQQDRLRRTRPVTDEEEEGEDVSVREEDTSESDRDEVAERLPSDAELAKTIVKETEFDIVPAVKGQLLLRGRSTLDFVPKSTLQPETTYTVTLKSVKTQWGKLTPPAGKAWTHQFTTPKFAFQDAMVWRPILDWTTTERGKRVSKIRAIVVRLQFSGPVDVLKLDKYFSWKIDGVNPKSVRYTSHGSVVGATLMLGSEIKSTSVVQMGLRPGVPLTGSDSFKAQASSATWSMKEWLAGKEMHVLAVERGESESGAFLEVICSDGDLDGGKRYRFGNEYVSALEGDKDFLSEAWSERKVSSRCILDDAGLSKVKIFPALPVTIAPGKYGFRLMGDFKRGSYAVQIERGATTVDGGVAKASFDAVVSFSMKTPRIGFVGTGRYLPRKAWNALPVVHRNVDAVQLQIRQVPVENLVFWMTRSSDDGEGGSEEADDRTSNLILDKIIPLRGTPDQVTTTWIDVGAMVPASARGLMQIRIKSQGKQATSRLLLTDINLLVKRHSKTIQEKQKKPKTVDEYLVWSLGMESGQLLPGIEVKLIRKSGFPLAQCNTLGAEACRLEVPQDDVDPSPPFALLASRGTDVTYLKLDELNLSVSESPVQGDAYSNDASAGTFRAAVYSDRGVYRPGERVHLAGVLRDEHNQASGKELPVQVIISDPRGKVWKRFHQTPNAAGAWTADVTLPDFAETGRYTVRVSLTGDKSVGGYAFQVEEFVPERLRLLVQTPEPGYATGVRVPIAVQATYLFGSAASGSEARLRCESNPAEFVPKENKEFHYGRWVADQDERRGSKPTSAGGDVGMLNEQGATTLYCSAGSDAAALLTTQRLQATVDVSESGSGRSTHATATTWIHPEKFYLGLQTSVEKARVGQSVAVKGVVVNWAGQVVDAVKEAVAEFYTIEQETGWFYDERERTSRFKHAERLVAEGKPQTVAVAGGKFALTFVPAAEANQYLIRIKSGRAQTDLVIRGTGQRYYYWPSESRDDTTPRPLRPTALAVAAPTEVSLSKPNDVRVKIPYRGKALFTVETDKVLISDWKNVEAGEMTWSFSLKQFFPNVYVSVFVVKDPHAESTQSFVPDRAFGVVSVPVERTPLTQEVKLSAPKEVRSQAKFEVKVSLGTTDGPAFVTVAAVDEGILSLTKFKDPNLLDVLLRQRALGVDTLETIGWSMVLPAGGPSRSTGGGDDLGDAHPPLMEMSSKAKKAGGAGRVMPVKPVALWSGLVPVAKDGTVSVPFQLPSGYRGSLRIMAVAVTPKKMGHASTTTTVVDPLTLQTTLPRFLVGGDEVRIPVLVSNMSGKKQTVAVSLKAQNLLAPGLRKVAKDVVPLRVVRSENTSLAIEPGGTATAAFFVKVIPQYGAVQLRVVAQGDQVESGEEVQAPILPAGPKSRRVQRIAIESDKKVDVAAYLKGWVPSSERTVIQVTPNPYMDVFGHLQSLVHYPYGCLEQTTSAARPLLALSKVLPQMDPTLTKGKTVEEMIHYAIERILSMQTGSGGLGFWPGDNEPYLWGTAYATHFLLDAQKAGHPVPESRLREILTFIAKELARNVQVDRTEDFRYTAETEAYLHYVMALAKQRGHSATLHQARMRSLIGKLSQDKEQDQEVIFLLKAALHLSGDTRYEADLKKPDLSPIRATRSWGWDFYSDQRRRGWMLSTMVDLFGPIAAAEPLATLVADQLRLHDGGWYTTQELVWGLTGLAKFTSATADVKGTPVLLVDGQKLSPQGKTDQGMTSWALDRASEVASLQLQAPSYTKGRLYLVLSSEGVRAEPDWKVGGQGLRLEREYASRPDADAKEWKKEAPSVRLGEVVYVRLKITNQTDVTLSNIAVVDRLPAGWEIENPRLGRGDSSNEGDLWSAEHMNIRDDRLELFGALPMGTHTVTYAIRATAAGVFTLPTAEAEHMYDPSHLWARTPSQKIRVLASSRAAAAKTK